MVRTLEQDTSHYSKLVLLMLLLLIGKLRVYAHPTHPLLIDSFVFDLFFLVKEAIEEEK